MTEAPPDRLPHHARMLVVSYGVALALIAVLVVLGLKFHDNPARYFGEGRPGTIASAVAFLLGAISAFQAFQLLRPARFARFWILASIGLVWLAIDEQFKGHETLDVWINRAIGRTKENEIDALDNLIVVAYAPIAGAIAWPFRRSLLGLRSMVVLIILGFVFYAVMALLDSGVLPLPEAWGRKIAAVEESCKLLSAVSIMAAVFSARSDLAHAAREP